MNQKDIDYKNTHYKKVNIKNAKPGDFITIFDMYGFPTVFIFKGFKFCGNDCGCDCYCYADLRSENVGFIEERYHIGYINDDDYYEPTPKTKAYFLSVLEKSGYEWKSDTLELIHKKIVTYEINGDSIMIKGLNVQQMANIEKLLKGYI